MKNETRYIELTTAVLEEGKWFDGLAAGEFIDMWGRQVEIKPEDMPEFLANTLQALEATQTDGGELVGLPIDGRDHEHGDAAGWIVDAALSPDGRKLRFKPRWTALGRELIESGRMRFFSATFSLRKKIVLGGTLTNWPATRDAQEKLLLRPIELARRGMRNIFRSKGEKRMKNKLDELTRDERAALAAEILDEVFDLVRGGQREDGSSLRQEIDTAIRKRVDARVAYEVSQQQAAQDVAEFCMALVGGSADAPRGLPGAAGEYQSFLMKLTPPLREEAMTLLGKIQMGGMIEFSELGHGRQLRGKTPLPQAIASKLDSGALTLHDLGAPILDLGDVDDYDLSKWQRKEGKNGSIDG